MGLTGAEDGADVARGEFRLWLKSLKNRPVIVSQYQLCGD